MAEKRKKRKRKTNKPSPTTTGGVPKSGGGGGLLQSMRSGLRQVAGVEQPQGKPSKLSNIIWTIVLVAAAALLAYRLTR